MRNRLSISIGLIILLVFITSFSVADQPDQFHPLLHPDQTYKTDTPVGTVVSPVLVPGEVRKHPRDPKATLHLYSEPGVSYFSGAGEKTHPYCEIWLQHDTDGPVLMMVGFINTDMELEAWQNSAAHGGHDPRHLFKVEHQKMLFGRVVIGR